MREGGAVSEGKKGEAVSEGEREGRTVSKGEGAMSKGESDRGRAC